LVNFQMTLTLGVAEKKFTLSLASLRPIEASLITCGLDSPVKNALSVELGNVSTPQSIDVSQPMHG